jgi:hypothetical protein
MILFALPRGYLYCELMFWYSYLSFRQQATHDDLSAKDGIDEDSASDPLVIHVGGKIAALKPETLAKLDQKSCQIVAAVSNNSWVRNVKSLREAARVYRASCTRHNSDRVDAETFYSDYSAHLKSKAADSKSADVIASATQIGGELRAAGVHQHAADAFAPSGAASNSAVAAAAAAASSDLDAVDGDDLFENDARSGGASMFSSGSGLMQAGTHATVVSTASAGALRPDAAKPIQAYLARRDRTSPQASLLANVSANMARVSSGTGVSAHESHFLNTPIGKSPDELLQIQSVDDFGDAMVDMQVNRLVWNSSLEKILNDGSSLRDMSFSESIEQLYHHLVTKMQVASGVAMKICRLVFAMKNVNHPFF